MRWVLSNGCPHENEDHFCIPLNRLFYLYEVLVGVIIHMSRSLVTIETLAGGPLDYRVVAVYSTVADPDPPLKEFLDPPLL